MADKTDKFCIAEHGLVGFFYPFHDSVKTTASLRRSYLSLFSNNWNCKFEMKRPESHTLTFSMLYTNITWGTLLESIQERKLISRISLRKLAPLFGVQCYIYLKE